MGGITMWKYVVDRKRSREMELETQGWRGVAYSSRPASPPGAMVRPQPKLLLRVMSESVATQ